MRPFNCSNRTMFRRRGRGMVALIFVLLLAGGGWYGYTKYSDVSLSPSRGEEPLLTKVTRGPFDHIVLEQGEIESSSNTDVINEVKSRGSSGTQIIWVIPEGTYVKKGDKLVELDSSALKDELAAQRIKVSSAEAQVISSEATVSTNEISLQEYLEGTYQSERKAILSEIDVAEQALRKSELNLDSARRLAAKGMLKGLQIEAEEFAVSNARNTLDSAQARLQVLDKLTVEKNRVQLASNIEASKAKLSSDKNVLSEELLKQKEIEEQVAKCTMKSPADGIVVYANERGGRSSSGDFVVKEGAIIRERQTIIRLPDPTKMQVKALVNESRIVRIRPGMASEVRVSAHPDVMLARVKRVNKYAEPGSWFSSSIKEYAAYLEILNPPEEIRTGMSAEVRIFVEQIPDAIQVPVHGVYEFRNHHFCLVKNGNSWETREIKIGATNEKMVTVTEGLKEDEEIALNPRSFNDLMKLPEIEEVAQRDEIKKLGEEGAKMAAEWAKAGGGGGPGAWGGPGGPGGFRGGPGGQAGGSGGAAGGRPSGDWPRGEGRPSGEGRPGGGQSGGGQRGGPRDESAGKPDSSAASQPATANSSK